MQVYEPAPKPVSQKLFSNPWVIGSLVTVILASMVWYLQSRRSDSPTLIENTITRDEAFEQQHQEELARAEKERLQKAAERRQQRQQQAQRKQAQKKPSKTTLAHTAQNTAKPSEATASHPPPRQLQMRFYEVPQSVLDQIYKKGRLVSESSVSRTLAISNAAELTALLQGGKPVGSLRSWNTEPGEPQTANYTNLSGEHKALNFDMNLEVVINKATGEGLNYQFRGDLFVAEGEDNPAPIELPAETHQVPPKGAIVVVGFLPHETLSEEAPFETLSPPLTVMGTPEFRTSETEFLIVLTPQ